jgi:methylenetetrahydrofolate reductase (NADPH)
MARWNAMPFARALAERRFAVALEITPPQRSLPQVLRRRAALIDGFAMAINVIQRPGRQSSLEASAELIAGGLNPTWHLVTRGRTADDLRVDLARAAEVGIRQVLCIRGDHQAEGGGPEVTIREAVALARELLPGALIGATLNQYTPDSSAALRNLYPKLAAGATFVQTQPVFDLALLDPLAEAVKERAPSTGIVAMAMPLLTPDAAVRIAERLGITLPPGYGPDASWDPDSAWGRFQAVLEALVGSPLVDGVAIMTFDMDPPPEVGARIVEALRAAGLSSPGA